VSSRSGAVLVAQTAIQFFTFIRVSQYQKGKTNLDFTEARDSEWQLKHLDHMLICTLHQTDNHASTPPLSKHIDMYTERAHQGWHSNMLPRGYSQDDFCSRVPLSHDTADTIINDKYGSVEKPPILLY